MSVSLRANAELRAIVATVAYTDQFDYPLTVDELWHRQLAPATANRQQFFQQLDNLSKGQIVETQQHYCLPGRSATIALRRTAAQHAAVKIAEARKVAITLAKLPWVEAVYLTGSLAMQSATAESDIDFLVITQPRRLWLVRVLASVYAQWKGKRRSWNHEEPGSWCFNLWLDTEHLEVEPDKHDLYRAYEVLQAQVLWSRTLAPTGEPRQLLLEHNSWIKHFLPRVSLPIYRPLSSPRIGYRSVCLDVFDYLFWQLQRLYMRRHRTTEQVARGYAFFHPRDTASAIMTRWQQSLQRGLPKSLVLEILHPYVSSSRASIHHPSS